MLDRIEKMERELKDLKASLIETDVVVLMDRSGSMQSNKSDHEGGLQAFVEKQKELPGNVYFTLVQFDNQNPFEIMYDGVTLDKVKNIKLDPRGLTPLRDAIGRTISHVNNRPKRDVIFLIVSDGQENSSKEYSQAQIKEMVISKKEQGWQFLFVGTNFDVITDGLNTGFDLGKNVTYTNNTQSINKAYDMAGTKFNSYRSCRAAGQSVHVSSANLDFSQEELNEIKEA